MSRLEKVKEYCEMFNISSQATSKLIRIEEYQTKVEIAESFEDLQDAILFTLLELRETIVQSGDDFETDWNNLKDLL